jgi:hypothetical protein
MTPKEKAEQLFFKYRNLENKDSFINNHNAKQCALIAVDLAIEYNDFHIEFLQEVKQEIEKL